MSPAGITKGRWVHRKNKKFLRSLVSQPVTLTNKSDQTSRFSCGELERPPTMDKIIPHRQESASLRYGHQRTGQSPSPVRATQCIWLGLDQIVTIAGAINNPISPANYAFWGNEFGTLQVQVKSKKSILAQAQTDEPKRRST